MRPSQQLANLSEVFVQHVPGLAALANMLPGRLIKEAIVGHGREAVRERDLPPLVMGWLVVGMSLFRDLSIENVLRKLVQELGLSVRWDPAKMPQKTSITGARDRLGWQVMKTLFYKLVSLLIGRHPEVDNWKGLPTYALDGTSFTTPDTRANEAGFGRQKLGRGRSAFPQFRGVLLVGAWSHYVVGALFAAWTVSELSLARSMLEQIPRRCLLLLDRLYYAYDWLTDVSERGTYFVVRAKRKCRTKAKKARDKKAKARLKPKDLQLFRAKKRIGRNEWLGVLVPSYPARKKRPDLPLELCVRLVKAERKGFRPVFLITNLMDRQEYSAAEVADLYCDRWEVELSLREIKCVLGSNKKTTFRCKRPDRVRQETYGLLIAYNCVRSLMADAAEIAGERPRQLSFVNCLLLVRTMLTLMAHADASRLPALYQTLLGQMAQCVLPPRRSGRRCPRAVKKKMSSYRLKRPEAA